VRVVVTDDFRAAIRTPVHGFRLVLGAEALRLRHHFVKRDGRNAPLDLDGLSVGDPVLRSDHGVATNDEIVAGEVIAESRRLRFHRSIPIPIVAVARTATPDLHRLRAAPHGGNPCPGNLDEADNRHQADEAVDLLRRAGDLEHEGVQGRVQGLGAEGGREGE
jgi:hypothetical protein